MNATEAQIREQALAIAQHAQGLADSIGVDRSAHSRALLIAEQVTTLVAWTAPKENDDADIPGERLCGCGAHHDVHVD